MISSTSINDWKEDCTHWYGRVLENTKYAHWCDEWDDLPINEYSSEFEACPMHGQWLNEQNSAH